ncbi:MAG TPA: peptidoglycan-binding protein [Candidatus Paceibacterota bacterium]|nr:peptidoglycan-binding protein [Candidatus Paceibacterota bacterium]
MRTQSSLVGFSLALLLPAFALAAQTTVSLGAGYINPSTVVVNAGDTVVWNNVSSSQQVVIANNGSFQSGAIAPGGQFAATFNTGGTYNYYDNATGSAISGTVIVSGTSIVPQPTYVTTPTQSGVTAASLAAEVQALIAEINAIQGQSGSGVVAPTSSGACPQIGRVLGLGSSGSDVSSLQAFLAANPSIYPEGQITGYYGALTQAAVQRWQVTYHIVSSGSPSTTGYGQVGPRTAAAMAIVCGGGTYNGVGPSTGTSGSNTVSGFIQVSPVSGAAPLSTNIVATVNTANACGGATYTLNFGDGTAPQLIPTAPGNCTQQNQTFQHTYQYGGSYTVTLSAGSHQSTAVVTVSGPGGYSTGTTNSSQPTGSITALISSGPAPLNATFYVSCASGLAYDVVFGDGTDLGSTGVSQSSCNGGLQGVAHTYSSNGSYTAQLEIFVRNSNGTVTPTSVASQPIIVGSGSSGSSGSNSTTYQPPTVTPNVGGNPLAVSLQYGYDTNGCQVSIQWGDGTAINPTGCSTFSGQTQTYTQTHTYAQAGSYTITLQRASQTNSVGVSITN